MAVEPIWLNVAIVLQRSRGADLKQRHLEDLHRRFVYVTRIELLERLAERRESVRRVENLPEATCCNGLRSAPVTGTSGRYRFACERASFRVTA